MMRLTLLFALCLFGLAARPALAAQDIISGVSTDLIQIRSDFAGTDIVVFGAIEGTEPGASIQEYDIVVILRGPKANLTVRRKERILGIWVNREQVTFRDMPGYYFLASTRPIDEIAPPLLLHRFQLGAEIIGTVVDDLNPDEETTFREAAMRNLAREQMFIDTPGGIEFLSQTLFRTRIPVPSTAPPGEYHAEVYLFRAGTLVTLQSSPVFVDKTGLERRIYEYAYTASLSYGLLAVFMSCAFGWLSFALFRPR
ncbi:MAG: hypothetical protein RJB62_1190 [Pseudomonadota bacterium]|jgi:uncharacterized protein (TIGR02186 family)